ncbi:MAG: recombinase family protein [Oscillospiraceae bacterium]|nr:recombinase family protein [Oscillospiraceae bacterium]
MNIIIYARFSSHSQNEQSIEGQLKVCYEYAERNGYHVVGEYIDRAISGTVADNRPEFQRMIADSAKRQFQAVLVYQLDRFARNRYDSATYKAKLKKHGVRVISARENISDDASGILIEGVLESMAEYYSVELGQKIIRGMALNAEKCLSTGPLPLGFSADENKRFIINESDAVVVKRIFEMYIGGSTMADIIRYLNENQVKTNKGNAYDKNSIRRILTNKRYCGIYTYKGTEIPDGIPRIIDDTTFADVQILMEKNKKAPARAKAVDENYILTTRLFCGHCEAAMTGVSGTSHTGAIYQYYQCVTNRRRGNCKKKTVKKAYIEDLVITETKKLLTPENIDKLASAIEKLCEKERNTDNLKRISKLIRENEAATNNLVKSLEAGRVMDVIYDQIEKRQSEKANLEAQLAKEKIQAPLLKYGQIKYFFEQFAKGDISDLEHRQAFVDTFVNKIFLFDDHMTIYYNAHNSQKINIPTGELRSSPMGILVELRRIELLSESTLT